MVVARTGDISYPLANRSLLAQSPLTPGVACLSGENVHRGQQSLIVDLDGCQQCALGGRVLHTE